MKIILTNITGLSAGCYSLFLYNIFDVINSNENSYSIITNFGNYTVSKNDCIIYKEGSEIPKVECLISTPLDSDEGEYHGGIHYDLMVYNYNKLYNLPTPSIKEIIEKYESKVEYFDFKTKLKDYFGDRVHIGDNYFIVYFPKVDITNSSNRQHTIYETYLKVYWQNVSDTNCPRYVFEYYQINLDDYPCLVKFESIRGIRTRFSEQEYNSAYVFSHLQRNPLDWANACLGEGILRKYQNIPINSDEKLLGYCMALENYLTWESLEGGPYIKISDIKTDTSNSNSLDSSVFHENMIRALIKDKFENLISYCNEQELKLNEEVLDKLNIYYSLNNVYFDFSKIKNKNIDSNTIVKKSIPSFSFNGKTINTMIIDSSLNKTTSQEILSGKIDKYKYYYSSFSHSLKSTLNHIKNESPNEFYEKKPLFRIS